MNDQAYEENNFCAKDRFSLSYDGLSLMKINNQFCDVQIGSGNTFISAHKNILASQSEYFHGIFTQSLQKSNLWEITDENVTSNSLELLIDFMYTSRLKINNLNVQELLMASNLLLLHDVKAECLKFIKQTMDINNLLTYWVSNLNKISELNDLVLSHSLKHFHDIVKSTSFLIFPFELLMEIVKSDNLLADELEVLKSVLIWLNHDEENRSKYIMELLNAIRLCFIPVKDLLDIIRKENLIKTNIKCINYLLEAIRSNFQEQPRKNEELSTIKPRNKSQIMNKSIHVSNDNIYKNIEEYTKEQFSKITKSQEFLSFTFNQTLELIESDNLFVKELTIFQAIVLWVKHDLLNRSELFPRLFKSVRLPFVPINNLVLVVESEELVFSNSNCMDILYSIYKMNALKSAGFYSLARFICNNYKQRNRKQVLILNENESQILKLEWFDNVSKTLYESSLSWKHQEGYSSSSIILNDGNIFSIYYLYLNETLVTNAKLFDCNLKSWIHTSYSHMFHKYPSIIQYYDRVYIISAEGIEYYDLLKQTWHLVESILKELTNLKLLVLSDQIYGVASSKAFYYNPKTDVSQLICPISKNQKDFAICSLDNQLYVIGGCIFDAKSKSFKSTTIVEKYNSQINTWIRVADMKIPRQNPGAIEMNGLIYVIGGNHCDSIEYYNPETNQWTLLKNKLISSKHLKTNAFVLGVRSNIKPDQMSEHYSPKCIGSFYYM